MEGEVITLSSTINVVVGMVFIYYVLSLAVSYVTNVIAKYTQIKAKNLALELKELLGEEKGLANFKAFMDEPLIQSLAPKHLSFLWRKYKRDVERIPVQKFSKTLLNLWFPGKNGLDTVTLPEIEAAINTLPDGPYKQAMLKEINKSLKQVQDVGSLVENWFNEVMVNIASLYKQRIRSIVVIVALVLTLIIGGDSIGIVTGLYSNPEAQNKLAALANQIETEIDLTNFQNLSPEEKAQIGEQIQGLRDDLSQFETETGLVLGWKCDELDALPVNLSNFIPCTDSPVDKTLVKTANYWLWKIIGLLVTWVAIAQGSSFWYQILKGIRLSTEANTQPEEEAGRPITDQSENGQASQTSKSANRSESGQAITPPATDTGAHDTPNLQLLQQLAVEAVNYLKTRSPDTAVNKRMAMANLKMNLAKQDLDFTPRQIEDAVEAALGSDVAPIPENEEKDNDDNQ